MRPLRAPTRALPLQATVLVGILINLVLALGGSIFAEVGVASQPTTTSRAVAELRQELASLQAQAQKAHPIPAQEAETRALNVFTLAESRHDVQVWNLTNDRRVDTIGRRDVHVFATSLELRGPREDVLAVLQQLPDAFQGNLLLEGVDVEGTVDAWNVRLVLRQVVQD